jgi:hypothetical protein
MTVILYRGAAGIAGEVTRRDKTTIESVYPDATIPPLAYGVPVKLISGKAARIEANDAASVVAGILARTVPSISGDTTSTFASGTPNPLAEQGLVVKGYVNVVCAVGTPARNGQVYMRRVADTGKAVGDYEATADVTVAGGTITGTGTGTIAATVSSAAIPGTWSLVLQSTSQTTKVTVIDPNGLRHPDATVGTEYTSGGLTFTITAAGTMTSGDSFAPVVTQKNVPLPGYVWAVDGKDTSNGNVTELKIA